jgi:hypothetical protein
MPENTRIKTIFCFHLFPRIGYCSLADGEENLSADSGLGKVAQSGFEKTYIVRKGFSLRVFQK